MKTLRGKRCGLGSESPEKVQECTVRNELGSRKTETEVNLGTSDLSKAMAWNEQTTGGQESSDTERKGATCPDQEICNKL